MRRAVARQILVEIIESGKEDCPNHQNNNRSRLEAAAILDHLSFRESCLPSIFLLQTFCFVVRDLSLTRLAAVFWYKPAPNLVNQRPVADVQC